MKRTLKYYLIDLAITLTLLVLLFFVIQFLYPENYDGKSLGLVLVGIFIISLLLFAGQNLLFLVSYFITGNILISLTTKALPVITYFCFRHSFEPSELYILFSFLVMMAVSLGTFFKYDYGKTSTKS